jgi:hypothetical protein
VAKVTIEIWDGADDQLNVNTDFGADFIYPQNEKDYMNLSNAQMAALGTIQTLQYFIQEGQLPTGTVMTGLPPANHE